MSQFQHAARRYGYKIKNRFQQDPFSAVVLYAVLLGLLFMLFAFRGMIATVFIKPQGIINPANETVTNTTPTTDTQTSTDTTTPAAPISDNSTTSSATTLQSTGTYTVKTGDTLSSIAAALDISWQKIADLNHLTAPYALKVGQVLQLPSA